MGLGLAPRNIFEVTPSKTPENALWIKSVFVLITHLHVKKEKLIP